MDLFDLVNSYIERGYGVVDEENGNNSDCEDSDMEEMKDSLKRLFAFDEQKRKAAVEIQKAQRRVTLSPTSSGFKLQLVTRLRHQGFDAGLCKSKWEKKPSGCYEYIDANINGRRYIIDLSLAGEFEIARPTQDYALLLDVFPQITVCTFNELQQIIRIMCDAIRKSMKQQRMHVPPWRRHEYVEAKWFGSYTRITNE
ncbi:uncharacterized protein LOC143568252 [Bidens hawaiensis]|uniref:uncharacterized protein LOC143568252 n=1 Tax=Bidens hawaiensis TaxID=980011 RepID=UPI00404AE861